LERQPAITREHAGHAAKISEGIRRSVKRIDGLRPRRKCIKDAESGECRQPPSLSDEPKHFVLSLRHPRYKGRSCSWGPCDVNRFSQNIMRQFRARWVLNRSHRELRSRCAELDLT